MNPKIQNHSLTKKNKNKIERQISYKNTKPTMLKPLSKASAITMAIRLKIIEIKQ